MALAIQNLSVSQTSFKPTAAVEKADEKLSRLMQSIINQKQENVQKALAGRVNVSEAVLIGGDLFSMGFLTFQGAQIVRPSISAITAVKVATLVCGYVAGLINIGVALVSLKEGIQAWKNGDQKLAIRLFTNFVCFFGIGVIMILTALALQVGAISGISAFFAANPWLLPILFFIVSIPTFYEILSRLKNIWQANDLASHLKTDNLEQLIKSSDEKNPFHLKPLLVSLEKGVDESIVKRALSERMELLQSDMGVEAALEAFKLIRLVLKKEQTEEQMAKFRSRISKWNRAQYVRLFQQVLYTAAFGVSLGMIFNAKINTPAVDAAKTFALAGGNAIPLGMDTFWPFKRNTLIVVPKVG